MSPKKKQTENKKTGPKESKPNFIIVGLAFAFFIIGIHQSMTVGFEYSYWIFMLSICLLLLQRYLRQKNKTGDRSK
jgi:Flp pilus assembly protein TadB